MNRLTQTIRRAVRAARVHRGTKKKRHGTNDFRLGLAMAAAVIGLAAGAPEAHAVVTAVSRHPGVIDLFAVGGDRKVYNDYFVEGDSGWTRPWRLVGTGSISVPAGAPVTVAVRDDSSSGRDVIDLFVGAADGRVYNNYFVEGDPGWIHPWRPIGNLTVRPGQTVTAVSRRTHIIDLFAVSAADGRVYNNYFVEGDSGWTRPWRPIGNLTVLRGSVITAIAREETILDLFVTGSDGRVYNNYFVEGDPGWIHAWRPVGTGNLRVPAGARVTALPRSFNTPSIDLFVAGSDGKVYNNYWVYGDPGWDRSWRVVGNLSVQPGREITVVGRSWQIIDLFAVDANSGRVANTYFVEGDPGWIHPWRPVGGDLRVSGGRQIAAVSRKSQIIDLFVHLSDGRVVNNYFVEGDPDWIHPWRLVGP